MPYEADDYLSRHVQTSEVDLTRKVDELVALAAPGNSPNLQLYREMLSTVIHMAQADRNRWDAKIMLQTLREMENAFGVLEQLKRRRKVTVFGSARTPTDHPVYQLARELGQTLSRLDLMVITGAGGGVMSGRQAANVLTRVTWILGVAIFATSIALTIIAARQVSNSSIMDQLGVPAGQQESTLPQVPAYVPPPSTGTAGDPLTPPAPEAAADTAAPATDAAQAPAVEPVAPPAAPAPAAPAPAN